MSDSEEDSIREITRSIENMIDQITDSVAQVDNLEKDVDVVDLETSEVQEVEASEVQEVETMEVETSEVQKVEVVPEILPPSSSPPVLTEKQKKEREIQLNKDMDTEYAIQKFLQRKRYR